MSAGASVAVNGVCSTVVKIEQSDFIAEYSAHTVSITNLGGLSVGDKVNLELPLNLSKGLDGHLVTGHVDGMTALKSIEKSGFSFRYKFELPEKFVNQIIPQGSIAINGISLTIASCENSDFTVVIIPHTIENTNLKYLRAGSVVNFETDVIGKYVERIISLRENKTEKVELDMNFLSEKGFI